MPRLPRQLLAVHGGRVDTGGGHLVYENVGDGTAVVAGNPSAEPVPAARDQSVGKAEVDFLLESADPRSGQLADIARARATISSGGATATRSGSGK